MAEPMRVLEVARAVVDEINELLDKRRLFYHEQMRESAGSITANIREALGRRAGRERKQFLVYARASSEETDERLRANFRRKNLPEPQYWRLHHRLVVIVKMLNAWISRTDD
jgi:four helix bundle protein